MRIQSILDYPQGLSHPEIEYQVGMRYWPDRIEHHFDPHKMKEMILINFDPDVNQLPMLAGVYMCDFLGRDVALEAWKKPYRHTCNDNNISNFIPKCLTC